ncbi:hypothetical protein [Methylobacterium durans]|jgi:hypothetical protein|uniref:Uncharacterized protein n=1 Tax=Methylobacterium durans TaxID=2202825 RepID=A0A2U8WCM2_9HYPH|nr:hypothetical protein [Methylobacterium durans]AWN43348.1 hypothetical protein DK389_26110 [Methylobacterium durans]
MDSRAGAASEACEAGAEPADAMRRATHAQMATAMIDTCGGMVRSSRVAELRAARRTGRGEGRERLRTMRGNKHSHAPRPLVEDVTPSA